MKLRHYDGDGRARFITFGTAKKIPLLTNTLYRMAVINAIDSVRNRFRYKLLGYVIMPDHVHLVIIPAEDSGVGRIVGEIKRAAAKDIIAMMRTQQSPVLKKLGIFRNGRHKHALWQRRCYDHNCRTTEIVWEKLQYCHNNPVKRGLVSSPASWKWSSYGWYAGQPGSVLEIDTAE